MDNDALSQAPGVVVVVVVVAEFSISAAQILPVIPTPLT